MARLKGESARDWYLRVCVLRDRQDRAAFPNRGPIRPGDPFPVATNDEMDASDRYELLRVEVDEAAHALMREAGG